MTKQEYDQINEQRERYKNSRIAEEAKVSFEFVAARANIIREKRGNLLDMLDSKTEKHDLAFALEELLLTIEFYSRYLNDKTRWEAIADAYIEKLYKPHVQDGDAV